MDKMHTALRRSGSRLKSMKFGHEDLHKIISDLKHMKYTYETFTDAQNTAWENMSKWAAKERNIALLETFQHLFQLNCIWVEVQREFIGNIKKFKQHFKKVLESEVNLDKSKAHLKSCEQKEFELRKNVTSTEAEFNEKIRVTKGKVLAAQAEVKYKILENENMKMITVKQGLKNFSQSNVNHSEKNAIISYARHEIGSYLPDGAQELQDIRFADSEMVKRIVLRAKENVLFYKSYSERVSAPPPPYALNNSTWQNVSLPFNTSADSASPGNPCPNGLYHNT